MTPPRGWKKSEDPVDDKAIEPPKVTVVKPKEIVVKEEVSKDTAKVIIVWKDVKGRERITTYTMDHLRIAESITEEFSGAKKKTFINLNIEGNVIEKL